MKKLLLTLAITLTACGTFTTGEGSFSGRLVDASWEGLIFKSCEVQFQYGEQSSSISNGSTRNKDLCAELALNIGKSIVVKYKTWARPCCLRMESPYEVLGIEVKK